MISRRRLLKSLLLAAAPASAVGALTGRAAAQQWRPPSQRSTAPSLTPPPLPRYERLPQPRPGYVWVPGHWIWSSRQRRYVWVDGRWTRNRPGFRYAGSRWVFRNGEWHFIPGQWVR